MNINTNREEQESDICLCIAIKDNLFLLILSKQAFRKS